MRGRREAKATDGLPTPEWADAKTRATGLNHRLIASEMKNIEEGFVELATISYMVRLGFSYGPGKKVPLRVRETVNGYIDKWTSSLISQKIPE